MPGIPEAHVSPVSKVPAKSAKVALREPNDSALMVPAVGVTAANLNLL